MVIFCVNNWRVKYRCISAYHFITVLFLLLPSIIILYQHLLSTNHKCTAAQKEKMDWNSSTKCSRLRVAPIAVHAELWSLLMFRFVESNHSL
jgi:hypothetical protein